MFDPRGINPISPGERTPKKVVPKPESMIYSEDVGSALKKGASKEALIVYGHVSDGDSVSDSYKVKITSLRSNERVIGLLQDDIQLRVASQWAPIVPTNALAIGNLAVQAVTAGEKSFITKASSRRSWVGTTPIVMGLTLRFEAVDNANREVVEPCRILQSLALPSEVSSDPNNPDSKDINLSPPGPSPFLLDFLGKYKRSNRLLSQVVDYFSESRNGEYIVIEIGGFVTFWNVIVSEVSVSVPPKFTKEGDPISATVNIVFETYEMPTVESLKSAYQRASVSRGFE